MFIAREDYWGGSPLLGKITIVRIADADARVNATLAGQIDMVDGLSAAQSSLFEGDPDFYLQESPKGSMPYLEMITTNPPFDDVRVRQALRKVVDPEEMIAIVANGHGVPACDNPTWPTDQYYLPQECPQDIEGARALLAEAGYPDGLTVELNTSDAYIPWIPMATVYKEHAALAGVTVEIMQRAADGYWANVWFVEPFAHSNWIMNPIDSTLSSLYRCGGSWNATQWCNEEQDALQDQARAELDFDARKALYQDIQRIIADEAGMINPLFMNAIRAINVRLQGMPRMALLNEYPYHLLRIVEP